MNTMETCPNCGKPVESGALLGLCADCLLQAGTTTSGSTAERFTPPTPAELAPLFPQLEIIELLGRGGMGAVYRARQKELDRVVALKILPPDIGRDAAFAARFATEARALAKLNHPNIVTIHDFGRTRKGDTLVAPADKNGDTSVAAPELFYFVMEFVDGVSLRQLLNSGRIAPREALAIVPQICDALQYAHDAGIVHRDIKPENILLDRRGRVKVADFGLAKLVGVAPALDPSDPSPPPDLRAQANTTEAGVIMGTPQYMAPEQREHPTDVDHRADIYSLGVVFYQMLTGELPKGDFAAPSKKVLLDIRLDAVVLRALEKTPGLRFQQVSEVKTLVETIATTP
ncbi:MAG: serine/threonine-protein kinase, partial [Kiritimatiellaeota bacterium]|nr:serine/threonine-protein kinase [Kiritimatiellota bacterium]